MKNIMRAVMFCTVLLLFNCAYAYSQDFQPSQEPTAPFRLFRTTNVWTFIKLETTTGKIWQTQFDIDGDNRFSVVLNSKDLAVGKEKISGRFTLYPTSNMYTFILLDQIDGRTWQIQWAMEVEDRLIIPIDSY